jgi:mannose-6-phosphate isomerase-like protein (cupin superfamily)
VRGRGELVVENERFSCEAGDVFFVAAGKHHRFENFTDDFASWAVFF